MTTFRFASTFAAFAWCLALCTAAGAQSTPVPTGQSAPYTLRYRFAAGQIRNYDCTIAIDGNVTSRRDSQKIAQTVEMLMSQRVESVADSGDATVLSQIVSAQSTRDGQTLQFSDAQIADMQPDGPTVISSTGRVLQSAGSAAESAGDPTGYLRLGQAQALPSNAVDVGASWKSTLAAAGLTMFTRSTLRSVASTAGGRIARISTRYYGATGKGGMAVKATPGKLYLLTIGSGSDRFNISTGTLQTVDTTLQTTATMAPPSTTRRGSDPVPPVTTHLTIAIHMTLLGADSSR